MSFLLPLGTNPTDLEKVIKILGPKIVGMSIQEIQKINGSLFTQDLINSYKYLGLLSENDDKLFLSSQGRNLYTNNSSENYSDIIQERIRQSPIYDRTIEFFYHNSLENPTKYEIASFWHDNYQDEIENNSEDDLTNAAIFFIRLLDLAGLGKYVQAGRGRETHIKLNQVKVAEYITSAEATEETIQKYEKEKLREEKESKEDNQTQIISHSKTLSGSNIRAISKLQYELTEKELDSPGAKKLIIDMLDRLEKENTVLKAKVETYQKIDKEAAILKSEVQSLSRENLWKTSVNSIGGIILGMSLSLGENLHQWIAAGLGLALIVISIIMREQRDQERDEN